MKLCPFCARKPEVKFHNTCYCVACKCGAQAPGNSVSENGAIRIWNRRRINERVLNSIKEFAKVGLNVKTEGQLSNSKSVLVMQVKDIVEEVFND